MIGFALLVHEGLDVVFLLLSRSAVMAIESLKLTAPSQSPPRQSHTFVCRFDLAYFIHKGFDCNFFAIVLHSAALNARSTGFRTLMKDPPTEVTHDPTVMLRASGSWIVSLLSCQSVVVQVQVQEV